MSKDGSVTIGVAIFWAAVILASAVVLKETPYAELVPILGGALAYSIIFRRGRPCRSRN